IRLLGGPRTPEIFTLASLLIVAGTAYIANLAGVSMSLGAFMAGVLLSESEYRHELQAHIAPFQGLLLAKAAVCFVLAWVSRQRLADAVRFSLALPQASEFSFVLFGVAVGLG